MMEARRIEIGMMINWKNVAGFLLFLLPFSGVYFAPFRMLLKMVVVKVSFVSCVLVFGTRNKRFEIAYPWILSFIVVESSNVTSFCQLRSRSHTVIILQYPVHGSTKKATPKSITNQQEVIGAYLSFFLCVVSFRIMSGIIVLPLNRYF